MTPIRIVAGNVVVTGTLNASETAAQIAAALPFEGRANLWGREVYFNIPVDADEENPQADVRAGALAYWPPGKALCLFFGQKPYSPVNVVGQMDGDPAVLSAVKQGDPIRVERLDT